MDVSQQNFWNFSGNRKRCPKEHLCNELPHSNEIKPILQNI